MPTLLEVVLGVQGEPERLTLERDHRAPPLRRHRLPGPEVVVEQLFSDMPARRKSLKSRKVELSHCREMMARLPKEKPRSKAYRTTKARLNANMRSVRHARMEAAFAAAGLDVAAFAALAKTPSTAKHIQRFLAENGL